MFYKIIIDQMAALEWDLNLPEAALFDFCYRLPSWADPVIIDGQAFYWAAKAKVMEEVPILTKKADTVYRLLKALDGHGVIQYIKKGKKDLIRLTDKGKTWGKNSEKNPSSVDNSEKNPDKLGKKSELNSEKNPTDNTTNIDSTTKDKKEEPQAKSLHSTCRQRFDFYNENRSLKLNADHVPIYWNKKEIGSLSNLIKMLKNSAAAKGHDFKGRDDDFVEQVFNLFCFKFIHSKEWFAETFTPSGIVSNYNKIIQTLNGQKNGKANSNPGVQAQTADDIRAALADLEKQGL